MIDYDTYLDRQIDKHLAEQEMSEEVSNCCGEPVYEDTDVCSECKEHCTPMSLGEYLYEEEQARREEAGDAQRDAERDERW